MLTCEGVDPYTIHVAHFVAKNFKLGPQGATRVRDAFSKLPSLRGYGSVLWFGFAIQGFVRMMAKTDEGCMWMALTAALSECYHEEVAAVVLHEMVLSLSRSIDALVVDRILERLNIPDPPSEMVPSVSEWLSIVKACQGTLSASNFAVRAETLMSLDRLHNTQQMISLKDRNRALTGFRGCSTPADLAASIMAIGKVSFLLCCLPIIALS